MPAAALEDAQAELRSSPSQTHCYDYETKRLNETHLLTLNFEYYPTPGTAASAYRYLRPGAAFRLVGGELQRRSEAGLSAREQASLTRANIDRLREDTLSSTSTYCPVRFNLTGARGFAGANTTSTVVMPLPQKLTTALGWDPVPCFDGWLSLLIEDLGGEVYSVVDLEHYWNTVLTQINMLSPNPVEKLRAELALRCLHPDAEYPQGWTPTQETFCQWPPYTPAEIAEAERIGYGTRKSEKPLARPVLLYPGFDEAGSAARASYMARKKANPPVKVSVSWGGNQAFQW